MYLLWAPSALPCPPARDDGNPGRWGRSSPLRDVCTAEFAAHLGTSETASRPGKQMSHAQSKLAFAGYGVDGRGRALDPAGFWYERED